MKALLLTKYRDPPLVMLGDTAAPVAAAGHVLVRVHAVGSSFQSAQKLCRAAASESVHSVLNVNGVAQCVVEPDPALEEPADAHSGGWTNYLGRLAAVAEGRDPGPLPQGLNNSVD